MKCNYIDNEAGYHSNYDFNMNTSPNTNTNPNLAMLAIDTNDNTHAGHWHNNVNMNASTDSIPNTRPDLNSRIIINSNSDNFNIQSMSPSMNVASPSMIENGVIKPRLVSMDEVKMDELPPEIPMVTMGGPDPNIGHHRFNPTQSSELDIHQDMFTGHGNGHGIGPYGYHNGNHAQNHRKHKKKKKRKRDKRKRSNPNPNLNRDHNPYSMDKQQSHNPSEGRHRMVSDIRYMSEGQRNSQHQNGNRNMSMNMNINMNMRQHGNNLRHNYHHNVNNMNQNVALPQNYHSPGPDMHVYTQK